MNDNNEYIIFKENGKWKGTPEENYNAWIRNANAILTFEGMRNKEDVIEYMNKYLGGMNNVRIIDSMMNDAAVNCNKFEILAKESGANFHNISKTKKDGVTYMKFVSSAPKAEQERAVKWLRNVLEGQEGSGVLSWGMRGTFQGEMSVMIKASMKDLGRGEEQA